MRNRIYLIIFLSITFSLGIYLKSSEHFLKTNYESKKSAKKDIYLTYENKRCVITDRYKSSLRRSDTGKKVKKS